MVKKEEKTRKSKKRMNYVDLLPQVNGSKGDLSAKEKMFSPLFKNLGNLFFPGYSFKINYPQSNLCAQNKK
jgi:hypothetical protein